ncbi:phage late control D family protein [Escherichia coli]|uniref:Phage late control D family protein n=2 Tax=Enterobacterales TaxID=91347 RepID=A0A5P0JAP9_ECOLX|nr:MULTISPECIES: phage late control D family protein [Enterobacteriaceae]EFA8745493.1 phage late control D family protein [Escherichia coli O117]EEU9992391.1 phage late control D family protein [Escherichia coli]EFB4389386.1 phage late control D family protein [Escherichia coli]EFI6915363.1 phage late control D family protein [Escherichia coli]EFL8226698.1 phage late control D family protein [Escherichia coli]
MSISAMSNSISSAATGLNNTLTDACKTPSFSIRMGGKVLKELSERVISIGLTDNRGFEADQLTLELDDSTGDIALPGRGVELSLWLGWTGEALVFKGVYTVDEVTHAGPPDRITVTARSADFREEFNVKREVSWHDVTVERVVSAIASRYDLKAQISDMLMNIEIDHADQTQESDMSFLTRMAEMLGAIATVKNGSLLFIVPGGGFTASGKPIPSIEITRSSGDRHRFRIADRDAYTGVRAYWLDLNFGKKKKVSVRRRASTKKADKSSSREGDYIEGADGNVFIMRKTFQNEDAARRAAAAKWQQLQRGAAEFSISLARGRAELYPEMHATVTGFKPDIDVQDWIISKVQHDVDSNGFTTQLNLEAKISDWIAETE